MEHETEHDPRQDEIRHRIVLKNPELESQISNE